MMEQDFYNFLIAWREWAQAGGAAHKPFSQRGLCANYSYDWSRIAGNRDGRAVFVHRLFDVEFPDAPAYPFNTDGWDYDKENTRGIVHKNPRRLAWVERKIAEYEEKHHE